MPNVLFLASWWPSGKSPLNGTFIKEHAYSLTKDHKLTVIYIKEISKSSSLKNFLGNYFIKEVESGRNIQVFEISGKIFLRRFGNLKRSLFNFINSEFIINNKTSFALLHLNVLPSFISKTIMSNSSKINIPIVLTEHSSYYHTEVYQEKASEIELRKNELRRFLGNDKLKAIMPVSENLGKILSEEYFVKQSKLICIPNVANDVFQYEENSNKFKSDTLKIVLAANWELPKNPMLFAQMLKQLQVHQPQIYSRLEITWIGEGGLLEEVKEYIKINLSNLRVVFPGFLSKQQISDEFNKSHLFVHPSSAENLPCIIIESLCCGCPVISAGINGICELINNKNGRLYNVDNIDSFYTVFIEAINVLPAFDHQKISAEAISIYSKNAVGKRISDVYNSIFANNNIRNK